MPEGETGTPVTNTGETDMTNMVLIVKFSVFSQFCVMDVEVFVKE